jgi:hypothetical protein
MKDVLIAGYPKSGNTWLGYIMSNLLNAKYIDLHNPADPPTSDRRVLDLIGWGDSASDQALTVEKSHSLPAAVEFAAYKKRILIVRDSRDVAVSYYYFLYYNLKIFQGADRADIRYRWHQSLRNFKRTVLCVTKEWSKHTIA